MWQCPGNNESKIRSPNDPVIEIAHEHGATAALPGNLRELRGLLVAFPEAQPEMRRDGMERNMRCVHHCLNHGTGLALSEGDVEKYQFTAFNLGALRAGKSA